MKKLFHLLFLAGAVASAGCVEKYEPKSEQEEPVAEHKSDTDDAGEKTKPRKPKKGKNIEILESLGYVDGTEDKQVQRSGVILHNKDLVEPGYNFYSSRSETKAELLDMEGKVVHRWSATRASGPWQHVTLLPNGDIIVLVKDRHLIKLDKDSKELWRYKARVHHDLWVHTNGDIYTLARETELDPKVHPRFKKVRDAVHILGADGTLKGKIDLLSLFEKSEYAFLIEQYKGLAVRNDSRASDREESKEFDFLHFNHVEVFDGSLASKGKIYAKGNILLSPRNTSSVFILNGTTRKIEWIWGPNNLMYQHHPTLLDNGNILIFNNGTKKTGSQVVEVNPLTNQIVWTYGPRRGFFSFARGSVQRLDNGNTLVTVSDTGYVFEVTGKGRKVWEFANPHRRKKTRMAIWRMLRFEAKSLDFDFNEAEAP